MHQAHHIAVQEARSFAPASYKIACHRRNRTRVRCHIDMRGTYLGDVNGDRVYGRTFENILVGLRHSRPVVLWGDPWTP